MRIKYAVLLYDQQEQKYINYMYLQTSAQPSIYPTYNGSGIGNNSRPLNVNQYTSQRVDNPRNYSVQHQSQNMSHTYQFIENLQPYRKTEPANTQPTIGNFHSIGRAPQKTENSIATTVTSNPLIIKAPTSPSQTSDHQYNFERVVFINSQTFQNEKMLLLLKMLQLNWNMFRCCVLFVAYDHNAKTICQELNKKYAHNKIVKMGNNTNQMAISQKRLTNGQIKVLIVSMNLQFILKYSNLLTSVDFVINFNVPQSKRQLEIRANRDPGKPGSNKVVINLISKQSYQLQQQRKLVQDFIQQFNIAFVDVQLNDSVDFSQYFSPIINESEQLRQDNCLWQTKGGSQNTVRLESLTSHYKMPLPIAQVKLEIKTQQQQFESHHKNKSQDLTDLNKFVQEKNGGVKNKIQPSYQNGKKLNVSFKDIFLQQADKNPHKLQRQKLQPKLGLEDINKNKMKEKEENAKEEKMGGIFEKVNYASNSSGNQNMGKISKRSESNQVRAENLTRGSIRSNQTIEDASKEFQANSARVEELIKDSAQKVIRAVSISSSELNRNFDVLSHDLKVDSKKQNEQLFMKISALFMKNQISPNQPHETEKRTFQQKKQIIEYLVKVSEEKVIRKQLEEENLFDLIKDRLLPWSKTVHQELRGVNAVMRAIIGAEGADGMGSLMVQSQAYKIEFQRSKINKKETAGKLLADVYDRLKQKYSRMLNYCSQLQEAFGDMDEKIKKSLDGDQKYKMKFIRNPEGSESTINKSISENVCNLIEQVKRNRDRIMAIEISNQQVSNIYAELDMKCRQIERLKLEKNSNNLSQYQIQQTEKLNRAVSQQSQMISNLHKILSQKEERILLLEKRNAELTMGIQDAERSVREDRKFQELKAEKDRDIERLNNLLSMKQNQIINLQATLKQLAKGKKEEQIRAENAQRQNFILSNKLKLFTNTVKSNISQIVELDDTELSSENFVTALPLIKQKIIEKEDNLKFLNSSEIYAQRKEKAEKYFLKENVSKICNKKVKSTKLLFQGCQGATYDQWLGKVQDKPNILVLMTLSNGHCIAAYSENPFSPTPSAQGKGFLMSVTNKRVYNLKLRYRGRAASYDKYIFKLGNNDLLIKSNLTFSVVFGKAFCFFDCGSDRISDFIGQDKDEGSYIRVEFHQIFYEQ